MTFRSHRILFSAAFAALALLPTTSSARDGIALDLVFSNSSGADQLCLRDGRKHVCGELAEDASGSAAVATGDVDGDGAIDVVVAPGEDRLNRLCRGDGAGSFTCSDIGTAGARTAAIALGDLNGDRALDIVFGNTSKQRNHACLSDGAGSFTCEPLPGDGGDSRGLAIGDVNGDGAGDIVAARAGSPSQVCLGNGAGSFTCEPISPDTDDTFGVALGDVNRDGNLDAVFANVERIPQVGLHNRVCLGDGAGRFACHDVSPDRHRSFAVALGDLDRDGHLDAVFANLNQGANEACFGDGKGDFDCHRIDGKDTSSNGVAIADVDGNGTLDIVFASAVAHRGEPNRVCLGDGEGRFECRSIAGDLVDSSGVAVGRFTPAD